MNKEQNSQILAILNLSIPEINKARHFIKLCNENPELYELITSILIETKHEGVLSFFLTEFDNITIKKKIPSSSGSEWSSEHLSYFKIEFEEIYDPNEICEPSPITPFARKFMEDNNDINGAFAPETEEEIERMTNTAFKGYLLYVQKSPSIESCVDDMMRELLQQTLGPKFLVKTRYEMELTMSRKTTKATPDVLAIFLPKLYMGIIIVEDKPHEKSKSGKQHENAEAQMVAEGIAIVQQSIRSRRLPADITIFMIRVLETNITFYRANFTEELITAVANGTHRLTPFSIKKLEHINPLFPADRPGYNLLKRTERNNVVEMLNNISNYIIKTFTI
jgi:hypothetical protein